MSYPTNNSGNPATDVQSGVDSALTFLNTLFVEPDAISYRPIEIWTENGKKRNKVDFDRSFCRGLKDAKDIVEQLQKVANAKWLNLFFGVCPRVGAGKGKFDQAWQIRTVRALWADIDYVTIEEVRHRLEKAGLPKASILVNSGNGVHVYWLLDSPYLINDVPLPPAVEIEWKNLPNGKNQAHKYIVQDGERAFLDQRKDLSQLSPKAIWIQDVLAGVARSIGGDHVTDLARLLRIPGTLNRKDQRNGREPSPCTLVEIDGTRRYPLAQFESFKAPSLVAERKKRIFVMPITQAPKITRAKGDKLTELIDRCTVAQIGSRSTADFALCCFAVRNGIAKDEVWSRVSQVGKFAERGQPYFEVTWSKAKDQIPPAMADNMQSRDVPKEKSKVNGQAPDTSGTRVHGPAVQEFSTPERPDEPPDDKRMHSRPIITVDSSTMPVADILRRVSETLLAAETCFNRRNQLMVIHDKQFSPILTSSDLIGLLNQHVEFYIKDKRNGGDFRPFPQTYANTWLNNQVERDRFPLIKIFTRNPVYTEDWRLVAPGFDIPSGIYYAGPSVKPRDSTERLGALLAGFCFKSPADRSNYLGMLLSSILMPHFIGSKPAVLFNGNQPELGKSMLAQIISILRDGQTAETATYSANDEEFEKRLGAIVRRGSTTVIIDNAKSRGRKPRIESACLERSITDPILSFRLLGQSDSIRAENSHIFCITANSPDVSRDLFTRCAVVNLYFEGDPVRRKFSIADPEGYALEHRDDILGELLGMVERWRASGMPRANAHSRFNKRGWANIIGGILEACGEPGFLCNSEEASTEMDETRRGFTQLVQVMVDNPREQWTPTQLAELCMKERLLHSDLGPGTPRSLATTMGILAGRFHGECFPLISGRHATFLKVDGRKGSLYQVSVREEEPNPMGFAERVPNLGPGVSSAP